MFSACVFAATSTWPGLTWPMSMKASVCSSSCTTVAGICFATSLQKMQFGSWFTLIFVSVSLGVLVAVALELEDLAVLQAHRDQRAAPHAAGVEHRHLLR